MKPSDCPEQVQGEIVRLLGRCGVARTVAILADRWPIRRSPALIPEPLGFSYKQLLSFAHKKGVDLKQGPKEAKTKPIKVNLRAWEEDEECATDLPCA